MLTFIITFAVVALASIPLALILTADADAADACDEANAKTFAARTAYSAETLAALKAARK